jgi:hypothetical protein
VGVDRLAGGVEPDFARADFLVRRRRELGERSGDRETHDEQEREEVHGRDKQRMKPFFVGK